MAFQPRQCGIDKGRSDGDAEARGEALQAHLDWVRREHSRGLEREEVERCVEIHSTDERDQEGDTDDPLAGEKLTWNHWILGKFGFPYNECEDEGDADEEVAKYVSRGPRVRVAARLQRNEAVELLC